MLYKLFAVAIVLLAATANAQTWHTADSKVVGWDAVAPIAPDDTIRYQLYSKYKTTDAAPVKVGGEIAETQATVTFTTEGRYYICVQAVRYPQGETEPEISGLACSNQPEYCAGGQTFGVRYFIKPNEPHGLR